MRLFAEERKTGTIELLFTHPISKTSIVLSKYFAGVLLVLFSLIPTFIYFISVWLMGAPMGNIDVGGTWGSYIGLFFLAAVYVAIGLFASSLTDNQINSFIIAAFLCFFFYGGFDIISGLAPNGAMENFISSLGIMTHYDSMSRGVIDSRDVVYFLIVSALFLFFTKVVIEKKS
jgi:ABC-2 type transport system permease protein